MRIESIVVDGAKQEDRYQISINGFKIHLTGKSFMYFTRLARFRQKEGNGWVWKEDLEPGFNQARYLFRMKGEISKVLGDGWPVVESNRQGYYRLDAVTPEVISFNESTLREHEDYDVRKLFEHVV
jgi:hypothetical protein